MKRAARRFANLLLLVWAVVGALAVVEVGLRYFQPQPMGVWHQDRDGLALHWPGLVTYLPQFGLSVSFNSAGMRDREHPIEKPQGSFRILVLGDSFMEALQIPFETSFPSLLEHELKTTTGKRIEIINASVSGWGTDDQLKYLTSYGLRWRPDLIIVAMTLYNDISDNLRERFHTMRDGVLIATPRPSTSFFAYKVIQLKGFLATRFHVYQLLIQTRRASEKRAEAKHLQAHFVDLFRDRHDDRMARGIELTTLLLERIRAVASSRDGRVALVLVPLAVQLSDDGFAEFARAAQGSARGLDIDRPQRLMRQAAERIGIDAIDLLPRFREWTVGGGGSLYLGRDGHWNQAGHRLAATIAGAEVARRGLAR